MALQSTYAATVHTRYGQSHSVYDPNDPWIVRNLVAELRSEQLAEPDNEHTQVSVSNEHWSVSADVSGLITLDNLDLLEGESSEYPAELNLRDLPDEQLIQIWQALVRNDEPALMEHPWKLAADLPPYTRDFYRCSA